MEPCGGFQWTDIGHQDRKFVSVTYCSSVERICACSDSGDLVFFKMNTNRFSQRRPVLPEERGSKCPLKLLIHQPMEPELIDSLHQLTRTEKLPASCNPTVSAATCWMELPLTQRQRRPGITQPWLLQQTATTASGFGGMGGAEFDGVHMSRLFKLHYDKFSWDEHFLEVSLPHSVPVAHVNLRFVLTAASAVPPEIQVILTEMLKILPIFI